MQTVFRLGEEALACPVTSAPRHEWEGRDRLVFRVEFPSFRDDRRTVEVGVVAVRGGSGRLKVVELELPPEAPYEEDQTKSPVEDLVEDMLSIVTVFSARLYGRRGRIFRQKVKDAMKEMTGQDGSGQKNNQNRTQF